MTKHGTPEGYDAGCTSNTGCPGFDLFGMSCETAYFRFVSGERRYMQLRGRGLPPSEIASRLGLNPEKARQLLTEQEAAWAARAEERRAPAAAPVPEPEPAPEPEPEPVTVDVNVDEPTTEVVERPDPEVDFLDEAAAQPLAERSNDPSESDETPPVDEAAAVHAPGEGVAEGEGMGHTTSTTLSLASFTAGLSQAAARARGREIREWCRANGHPGVPAKGTIPRGALAAYAAAHPDEVDATPVPADDETLGGGRPSEVGPPASEQESHGEPATELDREVLDRFVELGAEGGGVVQRSEALAAEISSRFDETELAETAAMVSAEALVEHGLVEGTVEEVAAGLLQSQRSELLDETRARIEEPPRPEWGEVAAASDVEHAREIAARLFLELTDAEAARDRAEAALALTLQKWDDMSARALVLELRLSVARMQASYLRDAYRVEEAGALDLADRLAIASDQVAALVARLDRAEAERDHLKSLIVSATTRRRRRRLRRSTS